MSAIVQQTFDYSVVDDAAASSLRRGAELIRGSMHQGIFIVGAELIKAKAQLGHGHFGNWLEAEFRMSETSARRYMRAAEVLGSKSATVAVLPPTAVYLLSSKSTPATIREDVIARLEQGDEVNLARVAGQIETARQKACLERKQQRTAARREVNKRHKARWEKGRPERETEVQQRRERAQATARELIDDLTLSVVRRVLDATEDWEMRRALRALCDSEAGAP